MSATSAAVSPSVRKIGWIGTGVMGGSMLRNLISRHPLLHPQLPRIEEAHVHTRTRHKAQAVIEHFHPSPSSSSSTTSSSTATAVSWAETVGDAARDSDVVFLIVGYPRDVRQVATECLQVMKPGSMLVDFTTSEPSLAREIHAEARQRGVASMDIPVSGGDIGAKNAALTMFVGGAGRGAPQQHQHSHAEQEEEEKEEEEKEEIRRRERLAPLLESMGRTINYMGRPGMGQHAKMANQIKIASTMVGVVECMLYAHRAGLDVEQTVAALGGGAAQSFSLQSYAPRILRGDMQPGFFVEHFLKDLEIALAECRQMGIVLPGLTQSKMLYDMLRVEGKEKLGTQALILVLEKINNLCVAKETE